MTDLAVGSPQTADPPSIWSEIPTNLIEARLMKPIACGLLLLLALSGASAASRAAAAIVVTGTSEPTPGLSGYQTYTLTATSTSGKVIGFNFDSSGGSGFGLFGALNQVDPFGIVTVFNDTPDAIFLAFGSNVKADTHFMVKSFEGIAVNAAESATSLTGAFNLTNTAAAPAAMVFAQLVARTATIHFRGQFTVETAQGYVIDDASFVLDPEPSAITLALCAIAALVIPRRRR